MVQEHTLEHVYEHSVNSPGSLGRDKRDTINVAPLRLATKNTAKYNYMVTSEQTLSNCDTDQPDITRQRERERERAPGRARDARVVGVCYLRMFWVPSIWEETTRHPVAMMNFHNISILYLRTMCAKLQGLNYEMLMFEQSERRNANGNGSTAKKRVGQEVRKSPVRNSHNLHTRKTNENCVLLMEVACQEGYDFSNFHTNRKATKLYERLLPQCWWWR